jgi:predicted ABC-class ATPase
MRGEQDLRAILGRIDGRGYPAYRELVGVFRLGALELTVDHVQGDPFAPPSRVRLRVPASEAGFPPELFEGPVRRTALEDFLARMLAREIGKRARGGSGEAKPGEARAA